MLSEKMEKVLNDQVNAELYSSYLYLSMSNYFATGELPGCTYWMKVQALEELYHAMKINSYIQQRGGRAVAAAIDAPPDKWDSPVAVFENVLDHEKKVTGLIAGLVVTAEEEKDTVTKEFLQWFVDEQEEEEESAEEVLDLAKKDIKEADKKLSERTFKIPKDIEIKFREPK